MFTHSLQSKPSIASAASSPQVLGSLSASAEPPQKVASKPTSEWTIADSNGGQITTDWRLIPGKQAGLLWWKKTYQTEVRHVITIKSSSLGEDAAKFTITTEVRERPNDNYPWKDGDAELGRASFERIRDFLLFAIESNPTIKHLDVGGADAPPAARLTRKRRARR